MTVLKKSLVQKSWFGIGMVAILLMSLGLRFWGLGRFNTLVFDEVYYAKFAYNYLSQTPFFDGHPPLSKYIIAIAMRLGSSMPFGQDAMNGLVGALFAPWTYRWLNALTGAFIPLVVMGIAYQLTHRRSLALLAGLFLALDNLFLVESRYALNNVYLLILGLLGWWLLLLALNTGKPSRRLGYLLLAGICFGAAVAIKWNGLWFLLGAWGTWVCVQFLDWFQKTLPLADADPESAADLPRHGVTNRGMTNRGVTNAIAKLAHFQLWKVLLYLGAVPLLTYILIWIPHLKLNAKAGLWADFWALQVEILQYHERVGSGPKVHPYCSSWYSWLTMWRPVAYFYKVTGLGDPLPTEISLPSTTAEKVIYDVHAMGNPALWWFSTIAIILVFAALAWFIVQQLSARFRRSPSSPSPHPSFSQNSLSSMSFPLSATERWFLLFVAVNYLANLLPWMRVTRCLFLYHYMGSYVFAILGLAWIVDRWLRSPRASLRQMGLVAIALVAVAFIFWLPISLGLPLSAEGFKLRMWLPTWV